MLFLLSNIERRLTQLCRGSAYLGAIIHSSYSGILAENLSDLKSVCINEVFFNEETNMLYMKINETEYESTTTVDPRIPFYQRWILKERTSDGIYVMALESDKNIVVRMQFRMSLFPFQTHYSLKYDEFTFIEVQENGIRFKYRFVTYADIKNVFNAMRGQFSDDVIYVDTNETTSKITIKKINKDHKIQNITFVINGWNLLCSTYTDHEDAPLERVGVGIPIRRRVDLKNTIGFATSEEVLNWIDYWFNTCVGREEIYE